MATPMAIAIRVAAATNRPKPAQSSHAAMAQATKPAIRATALIDMVRFPALPASGFQGKRLDEDQVPRMAEPEAASANSRSARFLDRENPNRDDGAERGET